MIATLTSLKLEPKVLSLRVMKVSEAFHLAQNVNQTVSEGVV